LVNDDATERKHNLKEISSKNRLIIFYTIIKTLQVLVTLISALKKSFFKLFGERDRESKRGVWVYGVCVCVCVCVCLNVRVLKAVILNQGAGGHKGAAKERQAYRQMLI